MDGMGLFCFLSKKTTQLIIIHFFFSSNTSEETFFSKKKWLPLKKWGNKKFGREVVLKG